MIICRRVVYSGRVQGVGFRWTTMELARERQLGGYVKNLDDGRVELLVEGEQAEVAGLLAAVEAAMKGKIESRNELMEVSRGLTRFRIEH